jgi:hypothetical protein
MKVAVGFNPRFVSPGNRRVAERRLGLKKLLDAPE